ncbi:hypothetical protein CHISP_2757 [Chitinispirillum alkaliphilum]|nr:hypothetical protein CHISP_2757 [Chitinispirillum alkaliphilum]
MNHSITSAPDPYNKYKALLADGEAVTFTLQGRSMEPYMKEGQEISVVKTDKLHRGDCCLINYRNRLLLHRLVKTGKSGCIFMGDNSHTFEIVDSKDVLGVSEKSTNVSMRKILISGVDLCVIRLDQTFRLKKKSIVWRIRKRIMALLFRGFYEERI